MFEKVRGGLRRQVALRLIRDLFELPCSGPRISFTFDDFLLSSVTVGAEILERYEARGTFYVNGATIDAQAELGQVAGVEDLRRLHAAGHEIGCHGHSHRSAFELNPAQVSSDLERNARFFAEALPDTPLRSYAYPYGAVSLAAKAIAASRFEGCRGIIPGVNERYIDRGLIRAYPLETRHLDHITQIVRATVRRNGWLVFFSHDVCDAPTPFGITPKHLDWVLATSIAAGCRVETVERVLAAARPA